MKKSLVLVMMAVAAPHALGGCTKNDGPQTYPVSGMVRFEGQPVQQGQILFRDPEGRLATGAAKIVNGEYSLRSTPGLKVLMITGYRPNGKFDRPAEDEPPIPVVEQYIPARYNRKSELKVEIAPSPNDLSFDLKSSKSGTSPALSKRAGAA